MALVHSDKAGATHAKVTNNDVNLGTITFKKGITTICYPLVAAGMLETADQEPSE